MLGRVSDSTAARPGKSRPALAVLAVVLLGVLPLAGAARAVAEQNADTGTLIVFVGGPAPAKVIVTPTPEPGSEGHPCEQDPDDRGDACVYTLPQGPVTLRAVLDPPPPPSSERRFLRWSDADCGTNPVCETTLTASHSVVASFSPVKLMLNVGGPEPGTVTATSVPGGRVDTCPSIEYPGPICEIEYETVTEVELEATPTNSGDRVGWNAEAFCDHGADPFATRCRAEVNFDPFWVGVGFATPPADPTPPGSFQINVFLRTVLGGDGSGRVTGVLTSAPTAQIINCPPDCSEADILYQRRVALTAHEAADSTFEGWRGICSTNRRCEFSAGAVTSVRAIFAKKQPPPPPAPPQPPPTPQRPQAAFSARILAVSVVRTRRARVVRARIAVNEAAAGRAQVRRGRRALTRRTFGLRAGANLLRLPLRARVRRGPAWFAITLRNSAGTTKSLRTRFFIPRRR